jgi:[protein-PII] uridylyltransferase
VLPERKTTEITFQAPDRPGLFADFTAALAAAGLSIRTARIHTAAGIAIDRFEVVGGDGGPVDLLGIDRMVRDLLWVLTGKQTAAELLAKRKPASFNKTLPGKPPRIEVHGDVSPESTVVDVYARDRLGLLHDITRTFHELDLDIQVAIVSTKVDQAADSFYVRELGGGKLSQEKVARLTAELGKRIE